jgi:hypothetical protein
MPFLAALPAIAGIGSSILGAIGGGGANAAATAAQQQALQNYQNLNAPQLNVNFNPYASAGQLTPQQAATINQGPNALAGIQTNPAFTGAETQSLAGLQGVVNSGGLNPAMLANLNQIQQSNLQQQNGARQAILQGMAQRGALGSGQALAAQLQNQQAAQNQANQMGLGIAGQAQQNALQAMMQGGQLGSQFQGQQFGQQAQVAGAQNAINQFNAQNAQRQANYNNQLTNQAQQYNLQNAQQLANANTGLGNQQQLQNNQYQQQNYQDLLQRAQGISGAAGGVSGQQNLNADRSAAIGGGIGQGINAFGSSGGFSNLINSLGGNGGVQLPSSKDEEFQVQPYNSNQTPSNSGQQQ